MAPTIPGFQGLKRCIQSLAIRPQKPSFYPSRPYEGSNVIRLTFIGDRVEVYTTQNGL